MAAVRKSGLLLLLLCAGCAPRHAEPPSVTVIASYSRNITLALTPSAPKSYDPTAFTVHLAKADGKPVRGAAVVVALSMPAMAMGENAVTLRETAPGTYVGVGRFTMAGDWRATVTVSGTTGHRVQAFPLKVQ